eukprot:NODE_10815_length_1327_cov_3.196667.p1 GENE.NODE_10815_length_1327_cov_3.196667~~NODE_10815_length_1327_cov_3.196667.p1  ORF type:complete len:313 (+),score=62.71 NODE_10815_length_1327_cov_3.196667:216-1154(+)
MDGALAANLTAEVSELRAAVAACAGSSLQVSQAELRWNMVGVFVLSLFINACFFVAEIGALFHRVPHDRLVDAYAHILMGPIVCIAFIDGGSFAGTFTFFFALWDFLCHTGRGCPSYVLAGFETQYEAWWWFECFLMCVHHVYIGAGKLAFDLGYFDFGGNERTALSEKVIYALYMWLGGACLTHLAMGMRLLSIRGSATVRVLSAFLRIGGQAVLIATQTGALRAGMILDMVWLMVMITTLLTFPPPPDEMGTPVDVSEMPDPVDDSVILNSDLHSKAVDTKMRLRAVQRAVGPGAVLVNEQKRSGEPLRQ